MDSIWKILLTILAVVALALVGGNLISANTGVIVANRYFDEVTAVIAESNYNQEVINDCITEADANGYKLTVTVVGNSTPGTHKYAEAVIEYLYEMPLFKISDTKIKRKII